MHKYTHIRMPNWVSQSDSIRVPLDFLVLVVPSRPERHLEKVTFGSTGNY